MNIDQAFTKLLGHEGGYSNNPMDPGGATMWGVTERVARAAGYVGDMCNMPQSFATQKVYLPSYWAPVKADQLPDSLRFDVFDGAVNSGVSQSVKWLQQSVGTNPDGVIGPLTIAAANAINPALVLAKYNGYRLMFMTNLSVWPTFSKGWARRIASNLIQED